MGVGGARDARMLGVVCRGQEGVSGARGSSRGGRGEWRGRGGHSGGGGGSLCYFNESFEVSPQLLTTFRSARAESKEGPLPVTEGALLIAASATIPTL